MTLRSNICVGSEYRTFFTSHRNGEFLHQLLMYERLWWVTDILIYKPRYSGLGRRVTTTMDQQYSI